ncbi:ATP-binding protein [Actinocorallia longicatena]|uniref:Histidine kinase/HSP90-like ATPase domain-containing protein n=1 Tax=Actinocorallia longicatena TaxID=111803 RepID=A0ABP6PXI9_9ACTN
MGGQVAAVREPTGAIDTNRMDLAAVGTAAKLARVFAKHTAKKWQLSTDTCEKAEFVISELCGNAIKATGTIEAVGPRDEPVQTITLRLALLKTPSLVVEVEDADLDTPKLQDGSEELAENGRGLFLVEALSKRWGFYHTTDGRKVVWAEIDAIRANSSGEER